MQRDIHICTAGELAGRIFGGGKPAGAAELPAHFRDFPREGLHEAARRVTAAFAPERFDFRSIVGARSGRSPEGCKWCAPNGSRKTAAPCHGWIGANACVAAAREARPCLISRFCGWKNSPEYEEWTRLRMRCWAAGRTGFPRRSTGSPR